MEKCYYKCTPVEIIQLILKYLDNKSLRLLMSTCRFFARLIKLVSTMPDETFEDLFQINPSINLLRMYLHETPDIREIQLVNILLAALTNYHYSIILEIIKKMNVPDKILNILERRLHTPFFCWPTEIQFYPDQYMQIMLMTILNADRLDIFKFLVKIPDCHNKAELLIYLTTYGLIAEGNFLVKMAYHNEYATLKYLAANNTKYYSLILGFHFESIYRAALLGGHLDLSRDLLSTLNFIPYEIIFHNITACLLRGNHIDKYMEFVKSVLPDIRKTYFKKLSFELIFNANKNNIIMPPVTLATFEFCMKEFKWPAKIPDMNMKCYIGVASIEIYQKYLKDEIKETDWKG